MNLTIVAIERKEILPITEDDEDETILHTLAVGSDGQNFIQVY
jgi:hypothetical protein